MPRSTRSPATTPRPPGATLGARAPRGGGDRARPAQRLLAGALLACLAACGDGDTGGARPTSVLLLTLDTTRADRLGCYGRAVADTPWLDGLAERGVLCAAAWTTAPITLPAHASILTGLTPPAHGARDNGAFRVDAQLTTLAELLREGGRRTAAFVAAFPLYAQFGLDQGFETYDDALHGKPGPGQMFAERQADRVATATTDWLADLDDDESFFAWTHFYDPHHALTPPEPFATRHADDPYQGEIAFMDAQIGRILAALERAGRLDDTLVVAVADHGEGLGEHGEATHAELIYDATMRVPLLLAGPGVPAGARVDATVSVVDVLPTVGDLLDLPTPAEVRGRSLAPLWRGEPGAAEAHPAAYLESMYPELHSGWSPLQGLVDEGWKLIVAPRTEGAVAELYDLRDDPRELRDLAAERADRVAQLRGELAGVLRATAGRAPDATREVSDAEAATLAQLGYVHREEQLEHAGRHPREMVHLSAEYSRARHRIVRGAFDEASRIIEGIEADDPGGLMALELRARLHTARGAKDPSAYDEALAAWSEAAARNPNRRAFWRGLSQVQRARGELLDAWRQLQHAITVAPSTPELEAERDALAQLMRKRAGVLAGQGRADEAAALRAALAEPEQP